MKPLLLLAGMVAAAACRAVEPLEFWRAPYRVIYGGHSMQPGDWELWDGVFNIVHYPLLGRSPAEAQRILDAARRHRMKVLSPVSVWDTKTGRIDSSKLQQLLEQIGRDEPALFGYVYEAAYQIPPERQQAIYDAIKRVDPKRPVWSEFSSTSAETWRRFNPKACDAVLSYNYPYEAKDRATNTSVRVTYSVRAISAVKPKELPVIPLLQAFAGSRWRVVPRGGMADQFDRWLDIEPIAGVAFYRWRRSRAFLGIPADGSGDNYTWKEVQQLCWQLSRQTGPFVEAVAWRQQVGRLPR